MSTPIQGFSKLSKEEKIDWVSQTFTQGDPETKSLLTQYWHEDKTLQKLHDEFIENTLSNFYVPLGIAPNFLINNKLYAIPMAIEESSVVAAASKAAKFWGTRGGFKTEVLGTEKIGQVHFFFQGDPKKLKAFFTHIKPVLLADCAPLTANMEKRGGGISDLMLRDKTSDLAHYFQIHAVFQTADAMGANFINSCLEQFATSLKREAHQYHGFSAEEQSIEVVMSILSNYVPNCTVRAIVSCPVADLFMHTRTTRGREDDGGSTVVGRPFNHPRDLLAHNRTHAGTQKPKVHHPNTSRIATDQPTPGNNRIVQFGLLTIGLHLLGVAFKPERIYSDEVAIELFERPRVHDDVQASLSRKLEMVRAVMAHTQVLLELDIMNDLGTVWTLVPEPLGHVFLLVSRESKGWLLEDGHWWGED